jgi:hypothetical protein
VDFAKQLDRDIGLEVMVTEKQRDDDIVSSPAARHGFSLSRTTFVYGLGSSVVVSYFLSIDFRSVAMMVLDTHHRSATHSVPLCSHPLISRSRFKITIPGLGRNLPGRVCARGEG